MARSFSVAQFKSNLTFGGARPTLFEVNLFSPPQGVQLDMPQGGRFLIRSAQIPDSTVGLISIPYFGRAVKMAGDRTFPTWNVTVINDEDFKLRAAMETWSNSINQLRGNTRLRSASNLNYKANAQVIQYSKTGETLRTYVFEGLYPQNIGAIDLAWDSTDQIENFQVSFEYDNWYLGNAGITAANGIGDQG
jgi:hypothetical protein